MSEFYDNEYENNIGNQKKSNTKISKEFEPKEKFEDHSNEF